MLHLLRPRRAGPVFVCPLDEAATLTGQLRAGLLVSISDPERRDATRIRLGSIRTKLCPLDFHDIERDAPGLIAPDAKHVTLALAALAKVSPHKPVLVHCHAGISRSSAMALILATSRHLRAGEEAGRAVELGISQVRAATPHARPNMRVIEIGSKELELEGTNFTDLAWDLHRSGI